VLLSDARPVSHAGATERIHSEVQLAGGNRLKIDDLSQFPDIAGDVVVLARCARLQRLLEEHSLYALQSICNQSVGAFLNPLCRRGIGWSARGWVVFEAAILRRIMRGRDNNAVGKTRR